MGYFDEPITIVIEEDEHEVALTFRLPTYREAFAARAIRARVRQDLISAMGGKSISTLTPGERDIALAKAEESEATRGPEYVAIMKECLIHASVDQVIEPNNDALLASDFLARHVGRVAQDLFFRDEQEDRDDPSGSVGPDPRRDDAGGEVGAEVQGLPNDVPGA